MRPTDSAPGRSSMSHRCRGCGWATFELVRHRKVRAPCNAGSKGAPVHEHPAREVGDMATRVAGDRLALREFAADD
jgi:hypothetical protein